MAETVGLLIFGALEAAEVVAVGVGSEVIIGSVTAATLVGTGVLLAGSVGVALLTSPSLSGADVPKPSDGTQTMKQAVPPRLFGYGRCRIAGAYMFFDTTDSGDSYDVIALHHGQITSIDYVYLADDLVTLGLNALLQPDYVIDVIGYAPTEDRYKQKVRIQFRLGLDTETAYDDVISAFPTRWTSAHRGDGIASAYIRAPDVNISDYWDIYPHGLPKLSVVANLTRVFDPRDETQSRSDPSTWTSSRNPVLQILDFLTSTDHGLGHDWDTFIEPVIDDLMLQADACDEAVPLLIGGTEPRYQSGGFAFLTTDPISVLQSLLLACDGWMTEGPSGTLALVVGKYITPTVTLTDDHITGFAIDHGVADEEAVNEIRFTFTPSANDYREAPGIPWQDTADIAERGRVRSQQLALTWVESHSQARRLAKRQMSRYSATLRGTMTTTLYGLKALGQRWIAVQSDAIDDLANAVVEVTRLRIDLTNARVVMDWLLVNPNAIDAWDETTEDVLPPAFPGRLASLALPVPANVDVTRLGDSYFDVEIDDLHRPDLTYEVSYNTAPNGLGGKVATYISSSSASERTTIRIKRLAGTGVSSPSSYFVVKSRNSVGATSSGSTPFLFVG